MYAKNHACQNNLFTSYRLNYAESYEPRHDKTNKMCVRPAKTQINVCAPSEDSGSESLLCALWVAKDPRFLHADSGEDTDQTGLI